MCDNPRSEASRNAYDNENQTLKSPTINGSHLFYELNRKREYHLRKLLDIQVAIDTVMKVDY